MRADGEQRSGVQDEEQRRGARELAAGGMFRRRRQRNARRAHQRGEDGKGALGGRHDRPPNARVAVVLEGAEAARGRPERLTSARPMR